MSVNLDGTWNSVPEGSSSVLESTFTNINVPKLIEYEKFQHKIVSWTPIVTYFVPICFLCSHIWTIASMIISMPRWLPRR